MSIKISTLEVNLFKGFKETHVNFVPGLNLLVGKNNSGKSSLLQAIYLAFDFLRLTEGISEYDKKRAIKEAKLRGSAIRNITLPFHEDTYISEGLKRRSRREESTNIKVGIAEENLDFMETVTFPGGNLLVISSNYEGRAGSEAYRKQITKLVKQSNKFPLFIPNFAGVSSREEIKMAQVVKFYIASGRSNEVLRNQLKEVPRQKLKKLNDYLKADFGVEIVSSNTKEIYLSYFYKESGKDYGNFDISSAGSGFQQVLQILVYIVTSDSDLILIDEPDAHLHYELQNMLYDILLEQVKDGKQIIVATHSQIFIKRALEQDNHLIITSKELRDLRSIDEYDDALKVLYEQGLVDEDKLAGGGTSKIISLEDSEDRAGFKIVKEFLSRLGIKEPNYKIISNSGSGETNINYITSKEEIEGVKLELLMIRDSDSLPEEYLDKIERVKIRKNVHMVFLKVHEIENYLLNPKIICRVLKTKNVIEVPKTIENIIIDIIKKNKDGLQDELVESIEGKLKNYYRDLGLEFAEISPKARNVMISIRKSDINKKISFLPGKKMFNLLKQRIHTKYKVLVSELDVAKSFNDSEIPQEIKAGIERFNQT